MAEAKHYVVFDGLSDQGSSEYTIEATGQIKKADNRIGGVSVSRDSDADVSGNTVHGRVWGHADGYRVYGGIKTIELENPEHVQLHTGRISREPPETDECEVTVRAESVDFISGQGPGEGALELSIEHDIHGAQSETNQLRLATGSSNNLGVSIDNFRVPRAESMTKQLTTKVREREVGSDWFVGNDDYGDATTEIVLECGEPKTVSQNVTIGSDRGNTGEIRVNYTVGDLSG
jgi:hypothetical protein